MKILVVSNGFPPRGQWGTEYYTHQLVSGLVERGHEVAVLHPERDGSRSRYTLEETTAPIELWRLVEVDGEWEFLELDVFEP